MNLHNSLKLWCIIGIGLFLLCGCAALSPAPKVVVGYLETESGSRIPAAFVDYAPGMTFSVQYSPKVEDITTRHSYYTETISYANGKKTEIEFFVTQVDPKEYEVSINGRVKKVPSYQEFTENIAPTLKEKISFTLLPNGFGAPVMKIPQMCPSAVELTKEYSPIASNKFTNSLDRIIIKCAETGKAHYLTFSYVRENNIDSLIQSFRVKIEETALTDPTPAREEAASGPSVPGENSKQPISTPLVVSAITVTPTNPPASTAPTETVVEPSKDNPTATPVPKPTLTATPLPTLRPAPVTTGWEVEFNEDFSPVLYDWNETPGVSLQNGILRWRVKSGEPVFRIVVPLSSSFNNDVQARLVVRHPLGLPSDAYGLVFRSQDEYTQLAFLIRDDGSFDLLSSGVSIIHQASAAIRPGDWNTLEVIDDGPRIYLSINGSAVADIDLKDPAWGQVGLAVKVGEDGVTSYDSTFEFDEFEVREP
jgi:hypothetical protein